ncbi:hypothetical protein [Streptomyces sp. B6B3]|uniref:hypothetical protein n=1 Tax=Streptomyces sp. B6B3 TaxID=3153570 RepID=UPI00325EBD0E
MGADASEVQLATRSELATLHNVSVSTLERLWAQRASNGHPDPTDFLTGRPGPPRPRWNVTTWTRWYENHRAQRRTATVRTGNPDDLGGPADFARACGHTDTTTISHWLKDPPSNFPHPDTWIDLPSGRRRPQWKLHRIWDFADNHRSHPGQHAGRRPGTPSGAHPYANDPRLNLAIEVLTNHPEATNSELIQKLQKLTPEGYRSSRPVWNRILNVARGTPEKPAE